jgi:hypothetical protein
MEVGDHVIYIDPVGKEHKALVTANWGKDTPMKSLNIVYVSDNEAETDSYGRQIKHDTSVVHESAQPAHGRKWREP